MATRPLIVIVGPTASGKTGLAIRLAQRFNGEIISADSRAIYRGMDIGTAKPTAEEQRTVQHWGIDLVEPDERFTAADFQEYANAKIDEIRGRGHVPFLVGGSGLYVDSVIFDYEFGDDADENLREKLNKMTVEGLQNYCKKHNILLPENHKNKRYLVRAIEHQNVVENTRNKIRENCVVVGIATAPETLRERIAARAEHMFCDELYDETKRLAGKYPFDSEAMKSNIYPIAWRLMNGEITRDEALSFSRTDDWHLAKRQMTWFKRNPEIKWLPLDEAETYIEQIICSK